MVCTWDVHKEAKEGGSWQRDFVLKERETPIWRYYTNLEAYAEMYVPTEVALDIRI